MFRKFSGRAPGMGGRHRLMARLGNFTPRKAYSGADRQSDFRAVFETGPASQRVLSQILTKCRVAERSYVPGDSLETARREGQVSCAGRLMPVLQNGAFFSN